MNLKYLVTIYPILFSVAYLSYQKQQALAQESGAQRTTLVVSQDPNGNGIQVIDPNNNRQLINTNNQQQQQQQQVESEDANDDATEEQVVRGLLEWLEEKKRKKKEKKENKKKRPSPAPFIQPILPPAEKKEIHIHINNHIKKKDNKKHKKHGGHYEDYHDGHYDHDYHDKHYSGKHSWPLLGHHHNWDHYGGHDHHGGDHHGGGYDDYGGHESAKVEKSVKSPGERRSAKLVAASSPGTTKRPQVASSQPIFG